MTTSHEPTVESPAATEGTGAKRLGFEGKKRLLKVMLVLFAIWPVVHGFLVERYVINPWRLFGWAMYCVPTYEPQVRFFGFSDGKSGEIVFPSDHPQAEIERIRYIRARGQIGELASPDVLAAELFEIYPKLDGLAIDVSHPVYQSRTRTFESQLSRRVFTPRRQE